MNVNVLVVGLGAVIFRTLVTLNYLSKIIHDPSDTSGELELCGTAGICVGRDIKN